MPSAFTFAQDRPVHEQYKNSTEGNEQVRRLFFFFRVGSFLFKADRTGADRMLAC